MMQLPPRFDVFMQASLGDSIVRFEHRRLEPENETRRSNQVPQSDHLI